jgi:hypothetical protein
MKYQNDDIFEAFKFARPGFLKIATEKSANRYKWVLSKMHSNIAPHGQTKTIQSYNVVNVFNSQFQLISNKIIHILKLYLQVYKIFNYRLWERYCEREWEVKQDLGRDYLHNHEFKRLFHGTAAADAIARNGFDINRSDPKGMLGQGDEPLKY